MWQPPLPNNGEVKVTINVRGEETVYFLEHYRTLNIEPFVEYNGNKVYLIAMFVNEEHIISTPKLYLDEHINEVVLFYFPSEKDGVGYVLESLYDVSFTSYLPQVGTVLATSSFPRASIYKGVKLGQQILDFDAFAFPVDLDKEDFEIGFNGLKFTLHLNRDNKKVFEDEVQVYFDIIKVEFYGELLPAEQIDDYIELKPKGV